MHVALIHESSPWPINSGACTRIASLISCLHSHGIKVTIIATSSKQHPSPESHPFIDKIETYKPPGFLSSLRRIKNNIDSHLEKHHIPSLDSVLLRIFGGLLSPTTKNYWKRYPDGLDQFVLELQTAYKFDAIFVEYIWMHRAVNLVRGNVPLVLDMHDLMYRRVESFKNNGLTFPLAINETEELDILDSFDATIAIQEEEAKAIESKLRYSKVIRAGVDSYDPIQPPKASNPVRLLYIGGDNPCNLDGISWFIDNVWPSISAKNSNVELVVAGNVCASISNDHTDNRIDIMGYVDDVRSLYANSSICINPINFGSGLKIKTIEALGKGRPLITTSIGIEGMNPPPNGACIVANTKTDWISALDALCSSEKMRDTLATSAIEYAREYLSPDSVYSEVVAWLQNRHERIR